MRKALKKSLLIVTTCADKSAVLKHLESFTNQQESIRVKCALINPSYKYSRSEVIDGLEVIYDSDFLQCVRNAATDYITFADERTFLNGERIQELFNFATASPNVGVFAFVPRFTVPRFTAVHHPEYSPAAVAGNLNRMNSIELDHIASNVIIRSDILCRYKDLSLVEFNVEFRRLLVLQAMLTDGFHMTCYQRSSLVDTEFRNRTVRVADRAVTLAIELLTWIISEPALKPQLKDILENLKLVLEPMAVIRAVYRERNKLLPLLNRRVLAQCSSAAVAVEFEYPELGEFINWLSEVTLSRRHEMDGRLVSLIQQIHKYNVTTIGRNAEIETALARAMHAERIGAFNEIEPYLVEALDLNPTEVSALLIVVQVAKRRRNFPVLQRAISQMLNLEHCSAEARESLEALNKQIMIEMSESKNTSVVEKIF